MKVKIIIVLIILLIGGLLFAQNKVGTDNLFKDAGSARLAVSGSLIDVLTAKTNNNYGLIFLFLDKEKNIISTLSVENPGLDIPSFRVVRGYKNDWLVVTTIENYGTGMREEKDSWYLVKSTYGGILKVLSYTSFKSEYAATTSNSKETKTNAVIKDDDTLDIEYLTKTCDEKNVCSNSTKTERYIWQADKEDDNKSAFVLS